MSPFGDYSVKEGGVFNVEEADYGAEATDWLLFFSMPTCPHCKTVYPTWKDVAEHYHQNPDLKVRVAQIDCTHKEQQQLCYYFGVARLPTFLLVRNNSFFIYPNHGERTFTDFQLFESTWYLNCAQSPLPNFEQHEFNMHKERTDEFHIDQYWLAFMQFAEMLGGYILRAGVPPSLINWYFIAALTVLINISPLLALPSLVYNLKKIFCSGDKEPEIDVNEDFVRVEPKPEDEKKND